MWFGGARSSWLVVSHHAVNGVVQCWCSVHRDRRGKRGGGRVGKPSRPPRLRQALSIEWCCVGVPSVYHQTPDPSIRELRKGYVEAAPDNRGLDNPRPTLTTLRDDVRDVVGAWGGSTAARRRSWYARSQCTWHRLPVGHTCVFGIVGLRL